MGIIDKIFKLLGVSNLEDTSDFQDDDDEDLEAPNLFVGKKIGDADADLLGEVIAFDEDGIQMKILLITDRHFNKYMDVGNVYSMFRHKHWTFEEGLMLWEVEPSSMKRSNSQIILQWENDLGWTWDLTS